jgi:hypothetical protein
MAAAVTVHVPASSANLGSAFDCAGLAVDMWDTFTAEITDDRGQPLFRQEQHINVAAARGRIRAGTEEISLGSGRQSLGLVLDGIPVRGFESQKAAMFHSALLPRNRSRRKKRCLHAIARLSNADRSTNKESARACAALRIPSGYSQPQRV